MWQGSGLAWRERVRFAWQRAKGVPIQDDLSAFRALALRARSIDLGALSLGDIKARALRLRAGIESSGEREGDLPLCFALAAAACRRTLGLEPYEEQLIAAAAMCEGRVAQLQTGEGKTLAAAFAASLGAMRGPGFHVLTANDYLARRDAEWMRPIYEALGLGVASISGHSSPGERRAAYACDLCYLTARELGFDFLRDGLAYEREALVMRPLASAIVDEADFLLIDEARVPLVIAGGTGGDGVDLGAVDALALSLVRGVDYEVDPEGRRVMLSLEGHRRVEDFAGSRAAGAGLEEPRSLATARLFAALHAHCLLERDVDYVVKEGSVKLVDSFTGRVAERRQWPWGIQAALEAKESLAIGPEGRIYGSIAVQHLMALYPRLAAMTATAVPAAAEFASAYGLGTLVIPPAIPSIRRDLPDLVFWTAADKRQAIVAEILREHARGRPVLVGTASVRESEELASELAAEGLPCVVLNARNDEEEARLVARAGAFGAVTISTNMAGRGTDIRLGGDPRIGAAGGLYVIGTNKHETRRVDDQLRGRAGRQGEPGTTRFFVSLEDPLFVRYGVRDFLPWRYQEAPGEEAAPEAEGPRGPIDDPAVRKEIARAQAIIEGQNSRIRRSLRRFSLIVEFDRRYLRSLRDRALLEGELPRAVEEELARAEAGPGGPAVAGLRPAMLQAFLARADAAWADFLGLVEDLKEGMGLLRYGGKDPGIEYVGRVGDAFEEALRQLEIDAISDCREILSGKAPDSVARAPDRPSSTWTYIVGDDLGLEFEPGLVSGAGALALGPLALPFLVALRALGRRRAPGRGMAPPTL
jgi:preprotein translocase subunit SecA